MSDRLTDTKYPGQTLGYQCMCSKNMNTASYHMDDHKCSKPCTGRFSLWECDRALTKRFIGDDSTSCGADGTYNTYYNSAVALAGPKQPSDSDKSYLGCFKSGTIQGLFSPEHEDIDTCRAFCKGYKYFGLTNAKYCNCGNEYIHPGALEGRVAEFSCK